MKAKLRNEYYGLGGSPNKVGRANIDASCCRIARGELRPAAAAAAAAASELTARLPARCSP